ncbi:MAG: CatB-related O-acetyltransferase [Campylobacterota bacterium]|nr:CatB-related O-acetyltransferase [Campylobacterota bacterium]
MNSFLKKIKSIIKPKPFYMKDNKKYKIFEIGDYTYGRPKVIGYDGRYTIKVGRFSSLATNITIFLGVEHQTRWVTTYPFLEFPDLIKGKEVNKSKGNVIIGNDVWIADSAMILSGVTIGDGAVVGARAVVAKDVQPYEIVGGNPAQHIRYRFDEETREKLLEIKWWDWNIEKVKSEIDLILCDDISTFVNKHHKKEEK